MLVELLTNKEPCFIFLVFSPPIFGLLKFIWDYICHRLTTSDNLLISIHERIKWADTMSELDKKHKKEVEDRVEEMKKSHSVKVS